MQLVMRLRWLSFLMILPIHAMEPVVGVAVAPQPMGVAQREIFRGQGYIDVSARGLPNLQLLGAVEQQRDIQSINASHNQLTHESLMAAQLPICVKAIDLSYNRLNEFPSTFIQRLPKTATYVDLSHNGIDHIGPDVQLPLQGLRVNVSHNRLRPADVETLRAHIARSDRKMSCMQRCGQFLSRPVSKLTNIIGSAALLGAYVFLKKYLLKDPKSKLSRIVKIAQNGLYFASLIRSYLKNGPVQTTIYNTPHGRHHMVIEFSLGRILLGCLGLLLIADTLALKNGFSGFHEQNRADVQKQAATMRNLGKAKELIRQNRIATSYVYGICASMRAAASVYAVRNCLSWCKDKIASLCNGYVERNRNQLISEPQVQ